MIASGMALSSGACGKGRPCGLALDDLALGVFAPIKDSRRAADTACALMGFGARHPFVARNCCATLR